MTQMQTKLQLEVLGDICAMTDELDIEFWLRGGWAIDFLLGKITRFHEDIDIVTWIQNRDQLEAALSQAGYKQILVKEPFCGRQSDFSKNEVDVQIGYLTYHTDGSLIMNGLPEWKWRADSLLNKSLDLEGISLKVMNPKQLLEEKEVYEQIGRTPRPKDVESKKILQQIIQDF